MNTSTTTPPHLVGRLAEVLAPEHRQSLADIIAGAELPFGTDARLRAYSNERLLAIVHLVEALDDPEDEQELYQLVCNLWLELRMEWTRYNQVMQYQLIRKGDCDPEVVARGGVCSAILGWLESCLRPSDHDYLVTLAADPLQLPEEFHDRVKRLIEHQSKSAETIERALSEAEEPLREIRVIDLEGYRTGLASLRESANEMRRLETDLVWQQVVRQTTHDLDLDGWFIRLEAHYTLRTIDPIWLERLVSTLRYALPWVVAHDLEPDVATRMRADRPAHLTVTVRIQASAAGIEVILETDGTGGAASAPGLARITATKSSTGSRITVHPEHAVVRVAS